MNPNRLIHPTTKFIVIDETPTKTVQTICTKCGHLNEAEYVELGGLRQTLYRYCKCGEVVRFVVNGWR